MELHNFSNYQIVVGFSNRVLLSLYLENADTKRSLWHTFA